MRHVRLRLPYRRSTATGETGKAEIASSLPDGQPTVCSGPAWAASLLGVLLYDDASELA